jgi:outer membrane lipoprotein-sorting protein
MKMHRVLCFCAITLMLCGAAVLYGQTPAEATQAAQAQADSQQTTYTGVLADATCKEKTPSSSCAATNSTSSFGILMQDGKFVKFDSSGNQKAKTVMSSARESGPINVNVTGKLQGDTLQVAAIQVA